MTFDDWMLTVAAGHKPTDDTVTLRILRACWKAARADERERCITAAEDAYIAGRGAKGGIDAIRNLI